MFSGGALSLQLFIRCFGRNLGETGKFLYSSVEYLDLLESDLDLFLSEELKSLTLLFLLLLR